MASDDFFFVVTFFRRGFFSNIKDYFKNLTGIV